MKQLYRNDQIHRVENQGFMQKLSHLLMTAEQFLFFVVILILCLSLWLINTVNPLSIGWQFLSGLLAILVITGCYLVCRILNGQGKVHLLITNYPVRIILLLLVLLFIVQLFILSKIHTLTGWDVGVLINSASSPERMSSADTSEYYSFYPNNLFLLFCYHCLNRGLQLLNIADSYFIIVVLNVLMVDGAIFLTTLVAKKLYGLQAGYFAFLLFVLLFGVSPWLDVPYSDTLALPFTIGAFYLFLLSQHTSKVKNRIFYLFIFGVVLAIGYLIKPTAIIVGIAVILIQLVHGIAEPNKMLKKMLKELPKLAPICVGLVVVIGGFQLFLTNQNIIVLRADKSAPPSHFMAMGLTEHDLGDTKYYGSWHYEDVIDTMAKKNSEDMDEMNREKIKTRIADMGGATYARFLLNKARWITSDGTFFWGGEGTNDFFLQHPSNPFTELFYPTGINYVYFRYGVQGIWMLVFLGTLLSVFIKQNRTCTAILQTSILGVLAFILIFEGRPRYLILYLPFFVVLASPGIYGSISYFIKWIYQKRVPK